jgi:hypothetical protein
MPSCLSTRRATEEYALVQDSSPRFAGGVSGSANRIQSLALALRYQREDSRERGFKQRAA